MQFLYVFVLMFLSIFGLAMLLKVAAEAFLAGCVREHDIYVRSGEGIVEFVTFARSCPHIGRVFILAAGNEWDGEARRLAERYSGVLFLEDSDLLTKTER
ncbi:MAG: hypothetical protein ACI4WS_00230 [Oscillospiraceae bacterium]